MKFISVTNYNPANILLFKVINRNTRKRWEIFSELTTKIPERRHWCRSGISGIVIVNVEHISHLFHLFFCWLWTRMFYGCEITDFSSQKNAFRSSRSQMLFKIELQAWRPPTLLKIDSNEGVFLWILQTF